MKIIFLFTSILVFSIGFAQEDPDTSNIHQDYSITDKISHTCSPILSQGKTGTCWSFSTTSFIESEIVRLGKGTHDLSELYQVRNEYLDKAKNYILRQGKAQFSQGALSHDVINAIRDYGIIPQKAYSGFSSSGEDKYNHKELIILLKSMVENAVNNKILSNNWWKSYNAILDIYIGSRPKTFTYNNKTYTPIQFAKELGVEANNYVSLTSFTHHPMYTSFILELPDNFSNGQYYNLPLDEFQEVVNAALKKGYTITWDGDVSEIGFSQKDGIAILTDKTERKNLFQEYNTEESVTQETRQKEFENYNTTDDHLMHLIGTAEDKKGNVYYKIKNSWGSKGAKKGYIYLSESYFRMKTVGVLLHKDGIIKKTSEKLNL